MKNEKKVDVKTASIDVDVLDVMKQDDVLKAISDETQIKRVILNCFCEFLSEIKELKKDFDEFMQTISICSADKLVGFFKEVQTNVEDETKIIELKEKMKKSHLKSKKRKKITKSKDKIVDFSTKDVK